MSATYYSILLSTIHKYRGLPLQFRIAALSFAARLVIEICHFPAGPETLLSLEFFWWGAYEKRGREVRQRKNSGGIFSNSHEER